jgi:hypothetical protein
MEDALLSEEPLRLSTATFNDKSLLVSAELFPTHNSSPVSGLIDSGCTARGFAARSLVRTRNILTTPTPFTRTLLLADGRPAPSAVSEYFIAPVRIGNHEELCLFFVTDLAADAPLIFGLPWLRRHNPAIDWSVPEISFSSAYCRQHCCPPWLDPRAPLIPNRAAAFHDLPIPGEPSPNPPPRRPFQAYVEDYSEDDNPQPASDPNAPFLDVPLEASPETHLYRTKPVDLAGPETRAIMIAAGTGIPRPIAKRAGSRRSTSLPKAPLPKRHPELRVAACQESYKTAPTAWLERPDLEDIAHVPALRFARFCQDPAVRAMTVTWHDLDRPAPRPLPMLPDISEDLARDILLGRADLAEVRPLFPDSAQDFLTECYRSAPAHLTKITQSDIDKFLAGKPALPDDEIRRRLPDWLRDLSAAFLPRLADQLPPHRSWDHRIELMPGREPPYQKSRPLSPAELQVVRKWLDDNLSKGFIRESRARCAAPLLLAAKPGGGVRICQDYRGLNSVTIKNRYPLPLIRETLDAVSKAKVFTKLDVIAAFNKLRIAEGHEWKTAFITRFGLFESLVMPFGLCNAPASFQHYINHTLFDLLDVICTAYLDDVLVFSASKAEHRKNVREVVKRLQDAGLQIDLEKCEFETTRTKYLGLIVTTDGIQMDPEKVKTIQDWLPPPTLRDLQRFLGFANFYRRFIQGFSSICRPLNDLLRKTTPWKWEPVCDAAFRALKAAFASAPILAPFDYSRRTVLETDASDWASGGILSQYDDSGALRPVAYFSSKHSAQECNYEIYDKELLAIIKSMEEWRPELQGSQEPVEILTDHKNLEYFMTTKTLNQRQVRWSEFLAGFNFRIVYRPGSRAVRPDALSRKAEDRPARADPTDDRVKNRQRTVLPKSCLSPAVLDDLRLSFAAFKDLCEATDSADISALPALLTLPDDETPIDDLIDRAYTRNEIAQTALAAIRDPETRRWPRAIRGVMRVALRDCSVRENRIFWNDKLWIPEDPELRTQIIYRSHSSGPAGHPGRLKTLDLVSRTYWWPRLSRDVQAYVKACELCIRTKAPRSVPPGFLQPLKLPFQPWEDISVDYITPLPPSNRHGRTFNHIAVVVDRLTKMRHFIPTVGLSAEELADAFVSRVYCLHGTPRTIVSDRGSQFVSAFWSSLSSRLGVTLAHSSAFHPETDGQTERFNAVLEQYLRAYMNFAQDDWPDWLPLAEFSSNNAVSETTGVSPFFANYGFNPRLGVEPRLPCPPGYSAHQKAEYLKANNVADRFERILSQLRALAADAARRYEENANASRDDSPRFTVGDRVFLDIRNMKTNRPMKKGDDKWAGPFAITATYRRACALSLPPEYRVFPVFHHSLLQHAPASPGLHGQAEINAAESRNLRGRILSRNDETDEIEERWEFDNLLDSRRRGPRTLEYLVQWKYHAATWQPAIDLKGCDDALYAFHRAHPAKPGPPSWLSKAPLRTSGSAPAPSSPSPFVRRLAYTALPADTGLPLAKAVCRLSKSVRFAQQLTVRII